MEVANDTQFGLNRSIFSKNEQKVRELAHKIESGIVHTNDHAPTFDPMMPFGGNKTSGLGRNTLLMIKVINTITENNVLF